jgi:hypothetical protein
MPGSRRASRRARASPARSVFLNVPYDEHFEPLFLAYIAGLAAFGLTPRAAVEITGGGRRLDRIFDLIRDCRYSIHDLSRVQLDSRPPVTPRFNMPFELGLVVGWTNALPRRHTWFVFEARPHRLEKSISDLRGTDAHIHDARPAGVFREVCNAFARQGSAPSIDQMRYIYRGLNKRLPGIRKATGAKSPYEAAIFGRIHTLAQMLRQDYVGGWRTSPPRR